MKAVLCVISDLNTDQRVHKVAEFISNQGYEVTVIGRRKKNSAQLTPKVYTSFRLRVPFEKGALMYASFNLFLFFRLLFSSKSEIYVANDLDTLLPLRLITRIFRKQLVYDSHELFTHVPELIQRPKIQGIWEWIERNTLPYARAMYTVNESIANYYSTKYKREVKVVRNASNKMTFDSVPNKTSLGIPENKRLLIMQGAGLNIDRGVEEAIRMMAYLDETVLMIVGDGDFIPQAKEIAIELGLTKKVFFFGKRPYQEMMWFTYHANLGLSLDQPTNPNYLNSLPNKVFDYIQAGTPIVCTPIKEIVRIVERHQIGCIIEECDPKKMAFQLNALLNDLEKLELFKSNCKIAAEIENWQHECLVLETIYPKVSNG